MTKLTTAAQGDACANIVAAQRFPKDPTARKVLQYLEAQIEEEPTDEQVRACVATLRDLAQTGYLLPPVHHDDAKLAATVATFMKADRLTDLSVPIQEAADSMNRGDWDPDVRKAYLRVLIVIDDAFPDGVDPIALAELLIGGTDGEAAAKLLVSAAAADVSDDEDYLLPSRLFFDALTPPVRGALLRSLAFVLTDSEIAEVRAAFARHRPGPSTLKPCPKHRAVRSPSGNAEFDKLGNIEQLDWLAAETAKRTSDSEGVRLFLYGMPWKNLFLMFNALEPVVRASMRRRR